MEITRRRFTAGAIGAVLASVSGRLLAKKPSELELGVLTFSFHDIVSGGMPAVKQMLANTHSLGLNSVEVFAPQLAPFPMPEGFYKRWQEAAHPDAATVAMPTPEIRQQRREQLKQWREALPKNYFADVRSRFEAARITIFALNYSFDASMADAEIDSGFLQAKALGTAIITTASTLSVAQRVAPFAERYRMVVAFHNTTSDDPDRVVTPESYAKVLAMSPWYRINLDVAHLFAAGYDPVAFIESNHSKIVSLHLHDRKKNNGPSVPNGEGDTPLREILLQVRGRRMKIPLFYELEWVGSGEPLPEIGLDLRYLRGLTKS